MDLSAQALQTRVETELAAWRAGGGRVLAYVGAALPVEVVIAAGLLPYRLAAEPVVEPHSDLVHQPPRAQSLAGQLLAGGERYDAAVVSRGPVADMQLFAVLRELGRLGRGAPFPVSHLDVLTGGGESRATYNAVQLDGLRGWLGEVGGHRPTDEDIGAAAVDVAAMRAKLRNVLASRKDGGLSGPEALNLIRTVERLPNRVAFDLLGEVATPPRRRLLTAKRVVVTGSTPETSEIYLALASAGHEVVSEDHDRGDPVASGDLDPSASVTEAILRRWETPLLNDPRASSAERAEAAVRRAKAVGADIIAHLRAAGDEASPWDGRALSQSAASAGLRLIALPVPAAGVPVSGDFVVKALAPSPPRADGAPRPPKPEASVGRRSRKSLASTEEFGAWQRDWFAGVREQAKDGPFAVVNADAPQEILRTLGVPYVINQWWASIVGAKQHGRAYGDVLKAAGHPANVETYSAQGLAAALAGEPPVAPWGGLPKPDVLAYVGGSDAGAKIFEAWSEATRAELFTFDRTAEGRWDLPLAWWDDLPDNWAGVLEPARLDLFEAELEASIERLEAITGRTFDRARFVEVMRLVNEQEHYYRRTRDLIAATHPAPIGIADSMPATMVPQWHRGSEWGRDAARKFYEEVARRVAAGEAACPGERLRLMWVGRGLWSDMGFYQKWEESHGAVFVWSMYLGLAADGYIREFAGEHDAMRALAARFVTMGDELRMPTWAGAWHVKEAKLHGCAGAVAIDDADPFVLEALEAAGIPVCRLELNNMSVESGEVEGKLGAFLDALAGR
jgi:benzoyl-CoA reductase/2-hydroxyglutaryl-CoA dehydratase subunit BcrC/BadD/HgdB